MKRGTLLTPSALLTLSALLPCMLSCESRSFEDPVPADEKVTMREYRQNTETDVDVLFVIDNSRSMAQEQANLRQNFGKLIDALKTEKLDGRIPNVHIGVVTTDLGVGDFGAALAGCETKGGDSGKLQSTGTGGCLVPNDAWISYVDGVTNLKGCTNDDPIECVKESFRCIADLGTEGCGFEMQLEAARRALDPELAMNPGFLRKDAFLAVIFITDEDDCSAVDLSIFDPRQDGLQDPLGPLTSFRCFEFGIQCDINDRSAPGPRNNCVPAYDRLHRIDDYVSFFRKLKDADDSVIMAAIAGPKGPVAVGQDGLTPVLMPSCDGAHGSAVPSLRIAKMVEAFDGTIHQICTEDFGPALEEIGKKIVASIGGQCIKSPLLVPNGGVACRAGVDACKIPGCPQDTSCDVPRGVCVNADGNDTQSFCGESCLDKADCRLELITGRHTSAETRMALKKCPTALFDPGIAKEACGEHCPCWRIVPHEEDCKEEHEVSPFGFEVMRTDEPAPKTSLVAYCRGAVQAWYDAEIQDLPFHCAPSE
ncbi:MAG: VWA domain-containing protein [Deltaproteobacteria bacterium]|nr:VWA domain-containing protein [Deltaproteobacteria bacterium]